MLTSTDISHLPIYTLKKFGRHNKVNHRWEKLSPCSIDGSSNRKKNLAEHIENPCACPRVKNGSFLILCVALLYCQNFGRVWAISGNTNIPTLLWWIMLLKIFARIPVSHQYAFFGQKHYLIQFLTIFCLVLWWHNFSHVLTLSDLSTLICQFSDY